MPLRAVSRLPRRRVSLILCLLFAAPGCFLSKKKAGGPAAASTLIVANSVFIDRLGLGDSARVQFKTTANTVCELAFSPQDEKNPAAPAAPAVVPCSDQGQPRTAFIEKLEGLRTDTLYFVTISVWVPPATKAQAQRFTVRETPDNPSIVSGGGSGSGGAGTSSSGTGGAGGAGGASSGGAFNELLVARLDIPLKSAEVHRHVPAAPVDTATIKAKLTRKLGCQQGVPAADAPFRDANADIGIKNLITRDFATATAQASPDHPERLQLAYTAVNTGMNQWSLLYLSANKKDVLVPVQPISQILNVEMESANITNFDPPQLGKAADLFKIDASKPLKFAWTTGNNLLELSYMSIQIGRPDNDKSIYCVFAASKGVGVIEPALLQNLDDGDQVVLVELASNQFWVKDGWLLTVYDWRSGRIEK